MKKDSRRRNKSNDHTNRLYFSFAFHVWILFLTLCVIANRKMKKKCFLVFAFNMDNSIQNSIPSVEKLNFKSFQFYKETEKLLCNFFTERVIWHNLRFKIILKSFLFLFQFQNMISSMKFSILQYSVTYNKQARVKQSKYVTQSTKKKQKNYSTAELFTMVQA